MSEQLDRGQEAAHKVLLVFLDYQDEGADFVRLTLGMALSAFHGTMLSQADSKDEKIEAAKTCIDTITRLTESFKQSCERFGIPVRIETGSKEREYDA